MTKRWTTTSRNLCRCPGMLSLLAAALIGLTFYGVIQAKSDDTLAKTTIAVAAREQEVRFGRDIRPILSDRCFTCHGPDAATLAADLRLDQPDSATAERDGITAIVPGHPEASELWRRINSSDPAMMMPPPGSNKRPLSDDEKKLLREWIRQGAVYEEHWAFTPPKRPTPPEISNATWSGNPIDRFVLARLEQEGLTPSEPADKTTLIRRLFLTLTGLPPTPREVDDFLADRRPDALRQWVDKLLTEEPYRTRYAERMAVPWLDAARYADTCGIHMDAGRQMWLWRDWVLNAFRENKPFDQFLTEQLAGDLIPEATVEQTIASGFNRNHVTTDEGGAISEEYLVEYAVDRTDTTSSVFLGLTVACARCHDHKFDPISQKEYYGLYAFFNSNEEPGLYSQMPDPNRALEPFITVPTEEQKAVLADLKNRQGGIKEQLNTVSPEEAQQRAAFIEQAQTNTGIVWLDSTVTAAESVEGATLTLQPDGSVLVSGDNPARDEHHITLETDAGNLRMLLIEALTDESLVNQRVGRASNGNAVVTHVEAEALSRTDPGQKETVTFNWVWADVEQTNGDFQAVNLLDPSNERGWAVKGHEQEGSRVAMLLAEEPFGFEGGTELRVRLKYRSPYDQHVLGRVRLQVAELTDEGLDHLPAETSGWYMTGPFKAETPRKAYDTAYGPEEDQALDLSGTFGDDQKWRFNGNLKDAQVNKLIDGVNAVYVGRKIFSPTARKLTVSLGSDDGFTLFLNGQQIAAKEVSRGVAPDQDQAELNLNAGVNTLVIKIVNVSGPGGFYYRPLMRENEFAGELVAALLPEAARSAPLNQRMELAWKLAYSPEYRQRTEALAEIEKKITEIEAAVPRTMVMKELPEPRETFLLSRGLYDQPDKNQPVTRDVPSILGRFPPDAPRNRLGLAQWMTAEDNPLVARVMVNRIWELCFGSGIVQTSGDFGLQGDWPSHPELLDWLAIEFRESGWDIQHILRLILTSHTWRQESHIRPEVREQDSENRLLTWYPRRRLAAEFIRDQALYISGLLVENLGGPSVKPYQPEGLWREVAMIQSNTRIFERDDGEALWRRSLYTYWKRACPPPSLMTFDAPTRESCTIQRSSTNTPLQALVLWNDDQFVEAARVLAQKILSEQNDEQDRMIEMFRRCTGRMPDDGERQQLFEALSDFRQRYRQAPEDAAKLLEVGEAPVAESLDPSELAAWTLIANAMLNFSETITQY